MARHGIAKRKQFSSSAAMDADDDAGKRKRQQSHGETSQTY